MTFPRLGKKRHQGLTIAVNEIGNNVTFFGMVELDFLWGLHFVTEGRNTNCPRNRDSKF